jgi:hypothetical protein
VYHHVDAAGAAALFGGVVADDKITRPQPAASASSFLIRRRLSTSTLWGPDVIARLEAAVMGKPFGGRAGVRRWRRRWGLASATRGGGAGGGAGETAASLASAARVLAARARRAGRAVGGVLAAAADLATAAAAFALAARLLMAAVSPAAGGAE